MKYLLPNILTGSRILLTPLFIYFLFWGNGYGYAWALLIFILAGLTDIWDGRLARRYQVESQMGKILDPLADKILVLSAFISFLNMDLIYFWMVAAIVLRDVIITALRFLLEYRDMPMTTSKQAKSKTALQITSIIVILTYLSLKAFQFYWITDSVDKLHVILILMYLTVFVTVYTGLDYLFGNRASLRALVRSNNQQPIPAIKAVAYIIGTFGGLGYLRPAPGTWGSLGAAIMWWLLGPPLVGIQFMLVVMAAGLGIWAGGYLERTTGSTDPSIVVIDEVAGMWLALLGCGPVLWQFAAAFILFRLLDIFKPGPIAWAQSLPRGWGIMADDLVAGGMTLAVLVVLRWVL